jgi:hypothetical protein
VAVVDGDVVVGVGAGVELAAVDDDESDDDDDAAGVRESVR